MEGVSLAVIPPPCLEADLSAVLNSFSGSSVSLEITMSDILTVLPAVCLLPVFAPSKYNSTRVVLSPPVNVYVHIGTDT